MKKHCNHVDVVQFRVEATLIYILIFLILNVYIIFFFKFVSLFSLDPNEEYKMNHKKRGMALIFNHENFYWHLRLNSRSGTNADRENLVRRYLAKQDMLTDEESNFLVLD